MKKSLLGLTLFALASLAAYAIPFVPEAGVAYQITDVNGNLLTWDNTKLRALPADVDKPQNLYFEAIADNEDYYSITFEGVEGYLAAKTANGWTATIAETAESDLAWFAFPESNSNPGLYNIKIKGVTRGGGLLGEDSGDTEVFTDKSDGALSVWDIHTLPDPNAVVESISIEPTAIELNINQTYRLSASVVSESSYVPVSWSSSDENIATVSSQGLVMARAEGSAIITAEAGGQSANCEVTVLFTDFYAEYELPDGDIRKDAYEGYRLVFAEEFSVDGDPDYTVWNLEDGYKRNNEDQYYINPNSTMGKALGIKAAYIQDGTLVIEARNDNLPNPLYGMGNQKETIPYTSASLQTRGNANGGYSWLFGIYEVRAKITAETGLWPAIWSTGEQYEWPYGGEIDIMEYYGNRLHANVCWGTTTRWSGKWNSKTAGLSQLGAESWDEWDDDYHIWRMYWDYDYMELWVDDLCINKIDLNTTVNANPAQSWYNVDCLNPFRQVRQMGWVNLALGGNNGGSLANTTFPSYYLIDYFRVYQKYGTDGKAKYHVDEVVSDPPGYSGVENVNVEAEDTNGPVEYFDLYGRMVVGDETTLSGIYIRRQGSTSKKILY